jgi:hypothetical protein
MPGVRTLAAFPRARIPKSSQFQPQSPTSENFSTDFHSRIKPLTSPPTPSNPATSATLIRTSPPRSNDHAVHDKMVLTNSNYHGTMSYESEALSPSDDLVVSAPPLCPPRLCVIFFRSFSSAVQPCTFDFKRLFPKSFPCHSYALLANR